MLEEKNQCAFDECSRMHGEAHWVAAWVRATQRREFLDPPASERPIAELLQGIHERLERLRVGGARVAPSLDDVPHCCVHALSKWTVFLATTLCGGALLARQRALEEATRDGQRLCLFGEQAAEDECRDRCLCIALGDTCSDGAFDQHGAVDACARAGFFAS